MQHIQVLGYKFFVILKKVLFFISLFLFLYCLFHPGGAYETPRLQKQACDGYVGPVYVVSIRGSGCASLHVTSLTLQ